MKVLPVSAAECSDLATHALDVDEAASLLSAEGLAASLRRAASFLCPTSPRQLIDAVLDALLPLLTDGAGIQREDLVGLLDLLVAAGDLVEIRRSGDALARLLYLGPPSYVERHPGQYLLTGIRPSGTPLISSDLADLVQYEGHTRTIKLSPERAAVLLPEAGLHEIRREHWVRRPAEVPADHLTAQMRQRLDASTAGRVEGLTVIGKEMKITYYKGRWRSPRPGGSGLFVGRRPQAYGADVWCLVLVADGTPVRLLDLPADDHTAPGHDEAWHVQAAIDAERGTPQVFRVSSTALAGGKTVDFFSPLPRWAERYLELAGMAVPRSPGALFSYRVPEAAMPDLAGFLASMLWMRQSTTNGAE